MLLAPMHPPTSHYISETGRTTSQTAMSTVTPQSSSCPSTVSHSNLSYSLVSNVTGNRRPSVRPKLTLQTTSLPRTFGTSSTGLSLSLATGPTASPTVRNTFKNAYEVAAPSSATSSPSRSSNSRLSKPTSPYTTNSPYQLPLGVKSILRNSPLEPTCRRRGSVAANGPNGGPGSRRVFFPAKKQVSYRQPLEEEIQTVRYTARHSDLKNQPNPEPNEAGSEEDSDSTASAEPSDASTSDDDAEVKSNKVPLNSFERKKRKHLSVEKQIRAVALLDGIEKDGSSTPQTPCQDRAKRRCEWRWTLGPLEIRNGNSQSEDKTASYPEMAPSISPASNPATTSPDNENDSPRSWVSNATSLSSVSEQNPSPSSFIALDFAKDSDYCKSNTTHEAERAHANSVQ
ncbi:hypothetical protein BDV23DRAFT_181977 [Aspergillus alliaceus]|uniref:Uncharacterized protein n=1 Tax=Petromyces alliaceus TaxID=209559 RepID=A0A5N6GFU3_PETAA|nr:uncharacterized protein BDW43DRAFT_257759 [Aspergillus alliaceus]KAB8239363.1 hypothetical protein BDW43DRAFT_257759 [Aspergillus alliaceus]KAE8392092.1 hypothetical protein BDV23DRAFT_181977 [Aspergillus alliaceus]